MYLLIRIRDFWKDLLKKKKEREKGNGNNREEIETFFGEIEEIIEDFTEKNNTIKQLNISKNTIKDAKSSYTLLKGSIKNIEQSIEKINTYLENPQLSGGNKSKLEEYLQLFEKEKINSEKLYSKLGKEIEEIEHDSNARQSNSLLNKSSEIPGKTTELQIVKGDKIQKYSCLEGNSINYKPTLGGGSKKKKTKTKNKKNSKKSQKGGRRRRW